MDYSGVIKNNWCDSPREEIMTFKESLLAVGTSLFVCSGTIGVVFFILLYLILERVGE